MFTLITRKRLIVLNLKSNLRHFRLLLDFIVICQNYVACGLQVYLNGAETNSSNCKGNMPIILVYTEVRVHVYFCVQKTVKRDTIYTSVYM